MSMTSSFMLGVLPHFDLSLSRVYHKNSEDLRAALLALAEAAERTERFDDLCRIIKEIIKLTANSPSPDQSDLSPSERQLLWVGYKNVLGSLRSSWRLINSGLSELRAKQATALANGETFPEPFYPLVDDYQQHMEKEIHLIASEILNLIENLLLKNAKSPESLVFYHKMAGDLYRYLAEIVAHRAATAANGNASAAAASPSLFDKKALDHYNNGLSVAHNSLQPTHPVRLAIALNYSVFLYESVKDRRSACELAKAAFDGAIAKLDDLEEAAYKDATLVMQLIRDNLTLWTQEQHTR